MAMVQLVYGYDNHRAEPHPAPPPAPVPQQVQPIVLNTGSGAKIIEFTTGNDGKISGATITEPR